jgi:hypothetical protein
MQFIYPKVLAVALILTHAISASVQCEVARSTSGKNLDSLAKLMPYGALAPPTSRLKYVVLGLGTQNYTCDALEAPSSAGAIGMSIQCSIRHSSLTSMSYSVRHWYRAQSGQHS